VVVYTWWLKRRIAASVVIGGWTGSCAVLAGWELAGPPLTVDAWALAGLVFLWTPAHFWGLAIARQTDYESALVPTLPRVIGTGRACRAMLWSTLPWASGTLGTVYLLSLAAGGGPWVWSVHRAWQQPTAQRAWSAYKMSGLFLLIVFVGMLLDVVLR